MWPDINAYIRLNIQRYFFFQTFTAIGFIALLVDDIWQSAFFPIAAF